MELTAPTPPDAGAPPHAPGDFAGTEVPAAYDMRGGKAPSALPYAGALRPSTPGDFLPDEKVTKESPGAAPLGTRWCEVSALFALAALSRSLRSAPARAGLVSATDAEGFATLRWCGQLATPSPLALTKRNILLLIRGSAGFWLHVWMQL